MKSLKKGQTVRIVKHSFATGKIGTISGQNPITRRWIVKFKDNPFSFGFSKEHLEPILPEG